jgi:hypothetical protein
MNKDALCVMLPAVSASLYLEQLRQYDFNPINPELIALHSSKRFLFELLKTRYFTKKI